MSQGSVGPSAPEVKDQSLALLVERLTARLQRGEKVDLAEEVQKHPEHAEQLELLWPALAALADLEGGEGPLGEVGDFRLIREVGRGGMGVVYEAEQLSLKRRVALKVLPFAATMDPRHLQRFRNEALAAASLHHEHIIQVYAVGCERGVHFYAMQFIDGRTLADVVAGLRGAAGPEPPERPGPPEQDTASTVDESQGAASEAGSPPAGSAPTVENGATTARVPDGLRSPAHLRRVAEWGIEAAEALEHAHSLGIVHRDVKPANLMIDGQGKLWVADFGLARAAGDAGLTMTGDLVGTLRYMSPEQALAKHGLVDHRTDVYSLGATLYELLTGVPAVSGRVREEILRRIALEEPQPLRHLNRAVPGDLETIVLKALALEPTERYASAGELADDLRRFLEERPIHARRPSLAQRAAKWGKRHRGILLAAVAGLGAAVITLAISVAWVWIEKEKAQAAYEAEAREKSLKEEERNRARLNAQEAQEQRLRAEDNLRRAVQAWGDSLLFFSERPAREDTPELAKARKEMTENARRVLQSLAAEVDGDPARRSEAALVHAGLADVWNARGDPNATEEEFRRAVVLYDQLVAEFPGEARFREAREALYGNIKVIVVFAQGGDYRPGEPQPADGLPSEKVVWALRLNSLIPEDWAPPAGAPAKFVDMAVSGILAEPYLYYQAAQKMCAMDRAAEAEPLLGRAIARSRTVPARYPGQVWPAYLRWIEAQALTLRGRIQAETGRKKEARADYDEAAGVFARMSPAEMSAFVAYIHLAELELNRGELLWSGGEEKEATEAFKRAEEAWKKLGDVENTWKNSERAWFLANCPDKSFRNPREAVELAQKAVKKLPQQVACWRALGAAQYRAGNWKAAAEALERAVELRHGGRSEEFFLAMVSWQLGDKEKARKEYDKAVAWVDRNRPKDEELRRIRAEAAALLGIEETLTKGKEGTPRNGSTR